MIKMADLLKEELELPENIEAKIENNALHLKGPKGETSRKLLAPRVDFKVEGKKIIIDPIKNTKREKKLVKTYAAHIKNMIKGVSEGHHYALKICSSHFPMTVTIENSMLSVKNYLGESVPRQLPLKQGVDVKVEGDKIDIESPDKELAGQTAASIERMCSPGNKDRRIFQDGIYIIEKTGKEI
ncbi:50S ribosomal protein L6 [Candidatus Woesearchaeota archaeon]|nr:50S ribosomal protein L6 [Candidatus Woesearchaeota archaeon]